MLKSKWNQFVIVKRLMGFCTQKYDNQLPIVDLHCLTTTTTTTTTKTMMMMVMMMMVMMIILSPLTDFSFRIHSSSFVVSVHTI